MSSARPVSSAVTALVVGSRYLPVYLALVVLVISARSSWWASANSPTTASGSRT